MWERFSYFGMRMLLVLYLISFTSQQAHLTSATRMIGDVASPLGTGALAGAMTYGSVETVAGENPGRGWSKGQANLLYGWYTGLAYLLPLVGGFLADKFLGTHRSVLIGSSIIALGHIALAVSGLGGLGASELGMSIFVMGLALIIIGTGYFKPCMAVMIGQMYGPDDPRRNDAYTIFYMGVNLGAFLCPFVCGTLGEKVGWHWGFGSAALGMLAGLWCYTRYRAKYLAGIGEPPEGRANVLVPFAVVSVLLAGVVGLIFHVGGFGWFVGQLGTVLAELVNTVTATGMERKAAVTLLWLALIAAVIGLAGWFVAIQQPGEKGPVAGIFIFMLFNAFFWIAFEQAGSTLNVFAKENTDRGLLGWEVPATWFQWVNPLLILLLGPVFAVIWTRLGQRGLDPPQAVKIGLGLLFLGGGYVFIVLGAQINARTGLGVSMFWLTAMYTLHTLGELCLSPTGLSFVTKAAPVRFVTLLMGVWFISSAMAYLGGGIIASYVEDIEQGKIELFWYPWFRLGGQADYFLLFVISSIGAGLAILLLAPLCSRMLHGKG
jgi:POT family proton-dependent oligopeptide transporter